MKIMRSGYDILAVIPIESVDGIIEDDYSYGFCLKDNYEIILKYFGTKEQFITFCHKNNIDLIGD